MFIKLLTSCFSLNKKHKCPVCLINLSDFVKFNKPLVAMTCGHVTCLNCLCKIILFTNNNLIKCPVCRQRTFFSKLKTNLKCIKCNRNLERLVYNCNLYHLNCGHCYCKSCRDTLLFKPFDFTYFCFICKKYYFTFPLYLA